MRPMRYSFRSEGRPCSHILPLNERSPEAFGTRGYLLDRTAGML
jgi:hypothetical protein